MQDYLKQLEEFMVEDGFTFETFFQQKAEEGAKTITLKDFE